MGDTQSGSAISDYGFLSDCSSAALVSSGCSLDRWCVPRFDSPSVFARLLDPEGGHRVLAPVGDLKTDREYVEETRGVLDHYLGRTGYSSQQTSEPADPHAPNYLFAPAPGDHRAHGPFDSRSHERSYQLPLSLRRTTDAAAGAALLAVATTRGRS